MKDAKLEGIDESLKTSFDIKVDYEFPGSGINKLLKKFSIRNEDTNKNLALKLDDNYNKYQNLVIKFTAKLNENKCKQCLNIFTKCQKTDPMFKFNSEIPIFLKINSLFSFAASFFFLLGSRLDKIYLAV